MWSFVFRTRGCVGPWLSSTSTEVKQNITQRSSCCIAMVTEPAKRDKVRGNEHIRQGYSSRLDFFPADFWQCIAECSPASATNFKNSSSIRAVLNAKAGTWTIIPAIGIFKRQLQKDINSRVVSHIIHSEFWWTGIHLIDVFALSCSFQSHGFMTARHWDDGSLYFKSFHSDSMPILNIYKRCNIQWLLFKALNQFSWGNYYVRCIIMTFGSIKNVYILPQNML